MRPEWNIVVRILLLVLITLLVAYAFDRALAMMDPAFRSVIKRLLVG